MKKMKLIHYLAALALLAAAVFGTRVIAGELNLPDVIEMARNVEVQPVEIPTEAPAEPATELPTEPVTEPPTEPATEPPTEPEPEHFLLTFVGDCTLGSNAKSAGYKTAFIRTVGTDFDYPFRNVIEYFESDDFSFANLEGTLGEKGQKANKTYTFRGAAEYTQILNRNSVDGVTLANNHSLDYGQEGYEETKRILDEAEIPYAEHMGTVTVTTERGLTIGLYALDFVRGKPDLEQMCQQIRELKETGVDLVVCAFHWGKENTFQATDIQRTYGQAAIDAGATIVWGHHPHVLQPIEEYNGGIIYYSLGNFVFGGNSAPKDRDTALVQQEVIREVDGTVRLGELTVVPCSVSSIETHNNYQPTPYAKGSSDYKEVMSKLDGSYKGENLPIG